MFDDQDKEILPQKLELFRQREIKGGSKVLDVYGRVKEKSNT